jgi:ADP-heptose:LPS heptosyltransferase
VPNTRRRKKVLVVRLDAIGDFILWMGAAERLRRLYPPETHHITLLADESWSGLAAQLPWWDAVWPVDRRRFRRRRSAYRLGLLLRIFAARFDIALHPTYSRDKATGDTAIRASRARHRIGFDGDLSNRTLRQKQRADAWYTRLVPAAAGCLPEIERNAEFVRALGATDFQATPASLPELPDEGDGLALPASPYFVLAPAARYAIKRWPPERFAAVAARLQAETGWQPIICGAQGEEGVAAEVTSRLQGRALNLCGRTTLPQVQALLRGARLVIANDTMAVHMAAAVGTPVVCVAGGGHWGRFIPYPGELGAASPVLTANHRMDCFNCQWRCSQPRGPEEPAACVSRISTDTVWGRVTQLLGSAPARSRAGGA